MIQFENLEIYNFMGAIRNMRNSWESWAKIDSMNNGHTMAMSGVNAYDINHAANVQSFHLGAEDKKLCLKLIKAGQDHAKFVRQILVSVDVTAPLYFFKQMDQYKVGTVTNSTSTMHTITKKPLSVDMFSVEDLEGYKNRVDIQPNVIDETKEKWEKPKQTAFEMFEDYLNDLEIIRKLFVETRDKAYWRMLIQMIPDSINQKRGITMNYQVLQNMYHSRRLHRLSEWREFATWVETLPYSFLITGVERE